MSNYTPSLDELRDYYIEGRLQIHDGMQDANEAQFARAIAKIKVEALREAADVWFAEHETRSKFYGVHFTRDWLSLRADNLEKP